jgi:hypothetical protein
MIKRTLVRSGLQLLGLCVLALFLSTARVDAAMASCEEQAAACAGICGTTVDWGEVGQYWDEGRLVWVFNWEQGWHYEDIPGYSPIYGATFGNGVEYWECTPGSIHGICQCRY